MYINIVFSACEKLWEHLLSSLLWYKVLTETENMGPCSPYPPSPPSHQPWWMRLGLTRSKQKRLFTDSSILILLVTQFSAVTSEAKVHGLSLVLKPPKWWQFCCPCCSHEPFLPFVWALICNLRDILLALVVWPCDWFVPDFPGMYSRAERKPECWLVALYRIQMHKFQYRLFLLRLCV